MSSEQFKTTNSSTLDEPVIETIVISLLILPVRIFGLTLVRAITASGGSSGRYNTPSSVVPTISLHRRNPFYFFK